MADFEPFFMGCSSGPPDDRRFCIYHPAHGATALGAVLYIHPFAEEMNKSRRMAAMQSRKLASAGYAVLQIDLRGCGDSSGDFGDATWQDWVDDVVRGAHWLSERVDAPLWLWGLRAGCLLVTAAAPLLPRQPHLLLWAPTSSGKQAWQQFMRMKAAADMAGGQAKTVLEALRADLAQGRAVEIAGYTVSSELARGLEQAALDPCGPMPPEGVRLESLDLSTRDDAELSPVARKTLTTWTTAGWNARGQVVRGPAFWQTTEIEDAPELLDATLTALRGPSASNTSP